jgi:hypothetical protein
MEEIWKDVPGLEGVQASSEGRVRTTRICKMVPVNKSGYGTISVAKKKRLAHILVAAAFLGSTPQGKEVNHKDKNRMNPRPDNLEYLTRKENIHHAYKEKFPDEQLADIERMFYEDQKPTWKIAEVLHTSKKHVKTALKNWIPPNGRRGRYQHKMSKNNIQVVLRLLSQGIKAKEISRMFDIDSSQISRIKNGQTKGR